jgi:hypothetical protein
VYGVQLAALWIRNDGAIAALELTTAQGPYNSILAFAKVVQPHLS